MGHKGCCKSAKNSVQATRPLSSQATAIRLHQAVLRRVALKVTSLQLASRNHTRDAGTRASEDLTRSSPQHSGGQGMEQIRVQEAATTLRLLWTWHCSEHSTFPIWCTTL